ncbi:MAG: hypothetical protein Q8P34_15365 [Bacteroidota bacterium]|nr:hypothetical protein [Bacteroidota bacterium]
MNKTGKLKTVLGVVLLAFAIFVVFPLSVKAGVLCIIAGLILTPDTLAIIERLLKKPFTKSLKYTMFFVSFLMGFIFFMNSWVENDKKIEEQKQEVFDKLPQHVKDSINLANELKEKNERIENELKEKAERAANELKKENEHKENENRIREEKTKRLNKEAEEQFNTYDGSHRALTELIKDSMHDPDSYEHIETKFRNDGNSIFVVTKYRGMNGFGPKRISTVTAKVDFNGNVIEIVSQ